MTDRMTSKDVKEARRRAMNRIAREMAGEDRLTVKDLESAEKAVRGLSLDALRDLGKGASNKGSKKMEGFSMGGMADYIKDLL
tara:strand:- start:60 stop:308 length:249 start_codon:yes stop_codon:yes gene_type:complete